MDSNIGQAFWNNDLSIYTGTPHNILAFVSFGIVSFFRWYFENADLINTKRIYFEFWYTQLLSHELSTLAFTMEFKGWYCYVKTAGTNRIWVSDLYKLWSN